MSNFQEICEKGFFYFPAWKHYNNPSINVLCDNCWKEDLLSCIGYGKIDLCLPCVNKIIESKNKLISVVPIISVQASDYDESTFIPDSNMNMDNIFTNNKKKRKHNGL
jgi:hypothetical protein